MMSMKTCSSQPIHLPAPPEYSAMAWSDTSSGTSSDSSRSKLTIVSIHFPYHFLPKPPVSDLMRSWRFSPSNS